MNIDKFIHRIEQITVTMYNTSCQYSLANVSERFITF